MADSNADYYFLINTYRFKYTRTTLTLVGHAQGYSPQTYGVKR